jgi:paired amphipathic helix protein Sin3a
LRDSRPGAAARTTTETSEQARKQEALSYLRELKDRLKDKKHTYDEFLEIMKEFKAQRIDTEGVIRRVKTIFAGHKDLILGFNQFLPKGHEIRLEDIEREEKEAAAKQQGGKPQVEFVHAISYVNKIKSRFASDERVYKNFLEILNMYRKNMKSISQVYEEVAQLFKSHSDLLEEFTYFLPDSTQPAAGKKGRSRGGASRRKGGRTEAETAEEAEARRAAANLAKELAFFEKVKGRLRNRDAYNEFIKILNIFNMGIITKMEMQTLVHDILGKFPELQSGFNDFVARCEALDFDPSMAKRPPEKLTPKDLQLMKVVAEREKFVSKPISELDLSTSEQCGPSYRLLPKNFPPAPCQARTELCQSVLNDNWVAVTSGSEDYSFKAMRKNQYEEALFRCEDDRFEIDMILATTEACMTKLEKYSEELKAMSEEDRGSALMPDGYLGAVSERAILRIYGERGDEVLYLVKTAPQATIPVVMKRLQQKQSEWEGLKKEMMPIWTDVYKKNYAKSLDHQSFYFKQMDKKALSAKGMTQEIKDLNDKKKTADENVGRGMPPIEEPDLELDFSDARVHDDVYAVIKFSTREMLSVEQGERVLTLYRNFLESFFNVTRSSADDFKDSAAEAAANFVRGTEQEDVKKLNETKKNESEADEDEDEDDKMRVSSARKAARPDVKDEEDEDMEESEEEEEKDFTNCKPASGIIDETEASAKVPLRTLKRNIFYANDAIYHMFRLHSHLYERLATARESAATMAKASKPARKQADVHTEFLRLLFHLLNGTTESAKFEDDCRTLLGAKSYLLFTLDKLIYKVIKQVQLVIQEEPSSKLLHLHDYELARDANFNDGIYRANACVLLQDEPCFRLASTEDGKKLMVRYVEMGPERPDMPTGTMDARFAAHLHTFINTPAGDDIPESAELEDEEERTGVYLERSKAKAGFDDLSAAMENTIVTNALECKVSCSTSKVSYVLDTEDVLHRSKSKMSAKGNGKVPHKRKSQDTKGEKARIAKVHAWIEAKAKEAGTEDPMDADKA